MIISWLDGEKVAIKRTKEDKCLRNQRNHPYLWINLKQFIIILTKYKNIGEWNVQRPTKLNVTEREMKWWRFKKHRKWILCGFCPFGRSFCCCSWLLLMNFWAALFCSILFLKFVWWELENGSVSFLCCEIVCCFGPCASYA